MSETSSYGSDYGDNYGDPMTELTSDNKLNPRIVYLVNDDTNTAIALTERDSIEKDYNEENDEFEAHTQTRVMVDPTTEEPKLSIDGARAVDSSALKELGVAVDDPDGLKYARGDERRWGAAHLEYFDADDVGAESEPELVERFENVRWDIESESIDGSSLVFSAECHIEGDIWKEYAPVA